MSTLKMNTWLNPDGTENYKCRAWVNLDQTTNTIRASGNISSITDIAVGHHDLNFATAMPDVNYCTVFGGHNNADGNGGWNSEKSGPTGSAGTNGDNKTVNKVRVIGVNSNGSGSDQWGMYVAIFR